MQLVRKIFKFLIFRRGPVMGVLKIPNFLERLGQNSNFWSKFYDFTIFWPKYIVILFRRSFLNQTSNKNSNNLILGYQWRWTIPSIGLKFEIKANATWSLVNVERVCTSSRKTKIKLADMHAKTVSFPFTDGSKR